MGTYSQSKATRQQLDKVFELVQADPKLEENRAANIQVLNVIWAGATEKLNAMPGGRKDALGWKKVMIYLEFSFGKTFDIERKLQFSE